MLTIKKCNSAKFRKFHGLIKQLLNHFPVSESSDSLEALFVRLV
jgi:hypothetical protein